MTAPTLLPSQRHLFELEDAITYINCAQTSPFLKSVRDAAYEGILTRTKPWFITAETFFKDVERVRAIFAQLVNAKADNVALVPSVSYGMATAAKNLPFEKGQHVLVLDEEFPSNYYAWKYMADRKGGTVRAVERPADSNWTKAVINAIDSKTAIVALPNCHWTDGSLVNLVAIRNAIGDKGGPALAVDGTQSLGALPLDVQQVKPDMLVGVTYKWLLGPYTYGMLYVDDKHLKGDPLEHNWISRKGSEDFTKLVDYQDEFQPGARRFDMGEKSNAILVPMVIAALTQLLDWGIGNINHTIRNLTDLLAQEAEKIGIPMVAAPHRAGHMIGIQREAAWPDALKQELLEKKIYVSYRGHSIRVSPHVYNSADEIMRLMEVVKKHV